MNIKLLFITLTLLLIKFTGHKDIDIVKWDANAGLIRSYTENASIIASSNTKESQKVIDMDSQTHWMSDAPLPTGFISRKDLNIFYRKGDKFVSSKNCSDISNLTDGDLSNAASIKATSGKAVLSLNFGKNQKIASVTLKCQTSSDISIFTYNKTGKNKIGAIKQSENYKVLRFEINTSANKLELSSTGNFSIFELAALADAPTEFVIIDLKKEKKIGTIYTRHWSGYDNVLKSALYVSNDKRHWTKIGDLDPANNSTYITNVSPEENSRYLKLEHTLKPQDWNKVMIWEIKVYDKNGHYGNIPRPAKGTVSFSEMFGVNAIWGWGYSIYSDQVPLGQGLYLYNDFCHHARNYHDITWDIKHPDQNIDFSAMAMGMGTPAKEWLNWDKEYNIWSHAGLDVQATIQIHNFSDTDWKSPYQSAYKYGHSYAKHFGTKTGNGLVCTMEIGNEPWKYNAETYKKILLGMAKGAKEADNTMEVFPCALQAADSETENTTIFKNYMGDRITKEAAAYLDGINAHCYSYAWNFFGKKAAVYPEHPNSTFREIFNAIEFRNRNMPGKKLYLSEWGWESAGGSEECTHDECVSENAAAVYAMRATFIAMRLGIDRASWFFFANEEAPSSLYTRSGLTTSRKTGFKKKKVYFMFKNLIKMLHDKYFLQIIREDTQSWIYLFGDKNGKPTHIVAWRPINEDIKNILHITIPTKSKAIGAKKFNFQKNEFSDTKLPEQKNGSMTIEVCSNPVIIELK